MVRGHHLVYYLPRFHRSLWSSPTSPVGWTENLLWSQITLPYIFRNLQSIRYLPIRVLHWLQFSIKLQKATTLLLLYICIQSSELNSRRSTPDLQLLTTTPSMVSKHFCGCNFLVSFSHCLLSCNLEIIGFSWFLSVKAQVKRWTQDTLSNCLLIEGNPFFHLP